MVNHRRTLNIPLERRIYKVAAINQAGVFVASESEQ